MSFPLLLLLGGAVLVLGAAASTAEESRNSQRRLPAPRDPERRREHPPARRVHVRRMTLKDEEGIERTVICYSPAASLEDSVWVVTAWHVAERDEEVIRVAFNPKIPFSDAEFEVSWGAKHDPNRWAFRRTAKTLWPDDKWNDRVIYRYDGGAKSGCFLIDVKTHGETVDFYHQSLRQEPSSPKRVDSRAETAAIEKAAAVTDPLTGYMNALVALRAERGRIETAELHDDDRKELLAFIEQRRKSIKAQYMAMEAGQDFLRPER